MEQIDNLIAELNGLSVHNPLYLLKINTLISLLRQESESKNARASYYRKILMYHRNKYKDLKFSVIDIVNRVIRQYSESASSLDLPLNEYFECRKQLCIAYKKLYVEEMDTPETVRKFLAEKLQAINGLACDNQKFWDDNFYLTIFVSEAKRCGLLQMDVCKNELSRFIQLKKLAIKFKCEMFNSIDQDLMKCFGDNVVIYDQLDVEKLKALYCFVTGNPMTAAVNSFMEKIYSEDNPLRIRADGRDNVIINFMSYVHGMELPENNVHLVNCIYNDERVIEYLPAQTKNRIRFFLYNTLKAVSDEALQSFVMNYVHGQVMETGGNTADIFRKCLGGDEVFAESLETIIARVDSVLKKRRGMNGHVTSEEKG
ncbi:hypothetical protein D7Y41_02420 [Anaerotruncus sp. 1XD22-93]|nr:hypothetical protein [Lachnospiraceae bacterium]NBI74284.1 hypothetical protein [Lachnospiraceae bacterium]RKK00327.1 hypothetical protein D7Y41_02420 [Anaerotruncus sp. 1XD22-93]